jgi:hypothetical protein
VPHKSGDEKLMQESANMKSCEEINGLMELFVGKRLVSQNDCFGNAMRILQIDPKMRYCEGVVDGKGFSLRHAWNAFDGEEFDLTAEAYMSDSMRQHRVYHKEFESSDFSSVAEYRNANIDKLDELRERAMKGEALTKEEDEFLFQNM